MSSTALFIVHQTKPGKRDEVRAIWMRHMGPAIQENPGHLAYFYNFDNDNPDSICAFQVYESAQAAQDFLKHPNYQAYLSESRLLLEHDPKVMSLSPQWTKSV
ncbi:antibiotic biosynthesis monooxygenase [Ottowia sp. GY511]|uniref:Quinol monooxygenase n=1 Tax=Ottowia flava TaxID=2675430 RepID=A0ABW4KWE1_9BURK|nr:antibiotic biosynthesis monooxygenase family protein [Ottowia sp. GY511]TXK22436.1 antibiotic biosynthesis monooxygenase [Ottowia sp. GY511]